MGGGAGDHKKKGKQAAVGGSGIVDWGGGILSVAVTPSQCEAPVTVQRCLTRSIITVAAFGIFKHPVCHRQAASATVPGG